jgi:hypothetical protein
MPLLPGIFASSGGSDPAVLTGGYLYYDADFAYRAFTVGTSSLIVASFDLAQTEVLVIAGGGGGGTAAGGGGGAGGLVFRSGTLTKATYSAVIGGGGGGAGGDGGHGASGANSTFDTITAIGGGGGNHGGNAAGGGSGGGAGYGVGALGGAASQGNSGGGTGYGFAGGNNNRTTSGAPYPSGGGGGAGGVGGAGTNSVGGAGGIGLGGNTIAALNLIGAATGFGQLSGGNYYFAGGGGGSYDAQRAAGGLGGGGFGGTVITASANTATDATENTGGGGGGGDIDAGGYPPVRAGNGGSGLVVVKYPRANATDVVTPTSVSGINFWYDATDAASITSSGGLVSQWNDKSGNGHHMSASGALRPTLTSKFRGGRNVITFGGSQYLLGTANLTANAFTHFIVMAKTSAASGASEYGRSLSLWNTAEGNDYSNANAFEIHWFSTTSFSGVNGPGAGPYRLNSSITATPLTIGAANIATTKLDGGNVTYTLNSTTVTGGTSTTPINVNRQTIGAGGASGGGDQYLIGWIGESIMFDRVLNATEITTIQKYLKDKWGV